MNVNGVTQTNSAKDATYGTVNSTQEKENKTVRDAGIEKVTTESKKKTKPVSGKTYGNPELTEEAQKYYEKLKKKYGSMDFVLVSSDKKEETQAHAGEFASANRMVVLIDTDKIEKMASDETYRKKYEAIISGATAQMAQLQTTIGSTAAGGSVKTYGMQVKDGGLTSFFAVIDKSMAAQRQRIAKNKEQKAEEKAVNEKKAEKKAMEEKLHGNNRNHKAEEVSNEDLVTVSASSVEELLQKINDTMYASLSDTVQTEEEKMLGQHIDFKG